MTKKIKFKVQKIGNGIIMEKYQTNENGKNYYIIKIEL